MTNQTGRTESVIATIALSRTLFVQGIVVRVMECGRVTVRVGGREFSGYPVAGAF